VTSTTAAGGGRPAPGPALGTAATPASSPVPPLQSRRRAWLVLGVVALVTALYLTGWSIWAYTHTANRYQALPPGTAGVRAGAEFRVLSLVRSDRLADSQGDEPQVADAGATFVVAQVEVLRQREDELFTCGVDLLGPDGRVWSSTMAQVQRAAPFCSADAVALGTPFRYESIFLVPERDADRLVGVALTDRSGPQRSPVLRPPA